MGTDGLDWLIDAPIPCPSCCREAVAKIAILKARDSIRCRYCGTAIDLTDPGTRVFIEEFSSVVASLFSGSAAPANSSTLGQASAASDIAALTKKQP